MLKHFLKSLVLFSSLLLINEAFAAWYETEGSAKIQNGDVVQARTKAIEEALRQAMLESGAFVSTNQNMTNGILDDDELTIASNNNFNQYTLVSEKREKGYLTVKIRLYIDSDPKQCIGMNYKKNILPVLFTYANNQHQETQTGLNGFNKSLTLKFQQFLSSTNELNVIPYYNQNLGIDLANHSHRNSNHMMQSIDQLAINKDAQYIVFGVIRDINLHPSTLNWFSKAMGNKEREFSLEIFVYDTITKEILFSNNYKTKAQWDIDENNTNTDSEYFWQSEYGENILEKLTSAAKSVSHTLVCKKPVGRILKVENNSQYHINLGKINNIKQGNRFLIEHSNNFNDKNGIRRFQKNQAKTPMVVTDVYNNTAVLKPITQSNGNVQINDHAYIE
ncbi:MAG: flagellar assembly protein T N-terminal domain-containing protein [Ruminobacter sp.]|nr:flagellar assembly protein T N-terminal domain-containing protein [Ruminobacter sp.]